MLDTNLSYSGKLIIDTKTRTTVKKNHGTNNLFRLFSTILCKEEFSTMSLPTYFMLYKASVDEIVMDPDVSSQVSNSLLRQYVDIISESSSKDNVFEATFTSMIDASMLSGKLADASITPLSLALISGDKRYILAAVSFDNEQYGIVSNGGQAYVKWIMSISNADDLAANAIANLLEE